MAASRGLRRRVLLPRDASRALALSEEAGWNQTESDWRLLIRLGRGWGLWTAAGELVATALTLPYGSSFAWISMVLVTAAYRRHGLATELMHHCLESLRRRGLTPVLDATEAGREVYLPLGFRDVYRFSRLAARPPLPTGTCAALRATRAKVRPMTGIDLAPVASYDAAIFGADRRAVLRHLYERMPAHAYVAERRGELCGYVLVREGRHAHHVGPLVAARPEVATALMGRALEGLDGAVYVDALERQRAFGRWLSACRFEWQRSFTRMILGRSAPFDDPTRTCAVVGPEFG